MTSIWDERGISDVSYFEDILFPSHAQAQDIDAPHHDAPSQSDSSNSNSPSQIAPDASLNASTGSPPQLKTKPPAKRKRRTVVPEQSANVLWQEYESPNTYYAMLYEGSSPLRDAFALGVRHIDKNIQQSPEGNSWIVYRQNQFKLLCYLTGTLRHYSTPVASVESIPPSRAPPQLFVHGDNTVVPVEELYFYLYAIKQHENEDKIADESRVALHQVGPSRTKRETKAPDLLPIVDGEAMFDKLQFQASTSVGGHAYFRVILRLVSKSHEGLHVVASMISPRMVVRAQNPGRYITPKPTPPPGIHPGYPPQLSNIPLPYGSVPVFNPPGMPPGIGFSFSGIPIMPGLGAVSDHKMPVLQQNVAGPTSGMTNGPDVAVTASPPHISHDMPGFGHTSAHSSFSTAASSMSSGSASHEMTFSKNTQPPANRSPLPSTMFSSMGLLPHFYYDSNSSPEANTPPDSATPEEPWSVTREVVYHHGRVGINTSAPPEALTVQGNIMVTGDILKPSDRRLKRNLMLVDSSAQMTTIENIKIYDYEIMTETNAMRKERGVIAQELERVIPEAVHHLGDISLGNNKVENLMVVNERMLLLENIGATQHLDRVVKREKEALEFVNNKVKELEEEELNNTSSVMRAMNNMIGLVMSEDFRESSEDDCLFCGISVLGLGPGWTLFILGFFFPPTWLLGTLYICSRTQAKRNAGLANALMVLLLLSIVLTVTRTGKGAAYVGYFIVIVVLGFVVVTGVTWYRTKRQASRFSVWKRLRGLMKEAKEEEKKKQTMRDSRGVPTTVAAAAAVVVMNEGNVITESNVDTADLESETEFESNVTSESSSIHEDSKAVLGEKSPHVSISMPVLTQVMVS